MRSYPLGRALIVSALIAVAAGCGSGDKGRKSSSGTGGTDSGLGGGATGGTTTGGAGGATAGAGGTVDGGGGAGGRDAGPDSSFGGTDAGIGGTDAGIGGTDAGKDGATDAAKDGAITTCTVDADCKDTNACDGTTKCVANKCIPGPAPTCTASDLCHQAACDPATGCYQQPLTGPTCNDNDPCTLTDVCVTGVCTGTGTKSCDDSNLCTTDSCTPGVGCSNVANALSCTDGNPCTLNDVCSNKACTGGATDPCDDGNPCTADSCDAVTGCKHTAVTDGTACPADGNPCTLDTCQGGLCNTTAPASTICRAASCTGGVATQEATCGGGTTCPAATTASCSPNPCNAAGTGCQGVCTVDTDCNIGTPAYCDTLTGTCIAKKGLGSTCSRNGMCSNDQCVDGVCCASTCGGGNPNDCVVCNATPGTCTPLDGVTCSDGDACTQGDSCVSGACFGVAKLCDDNNPCTADSCDPVSGCTHTPVTGTPCNDGNACTTVDTCQAGTCVGSSPLPCDDGIFCNGTETCSPTLGCQVGTPVVCVDDGRTCTAEFCDEGLKACRTVVQDSLCSNGLFCDGVEKCDPTNPSSNATTGCVAGAAQVCNDGIACTADTCNESLKKCTFTTNNAACSDGNACNGTELCDALTGCKAGTPVVCNDGVYCTTDSCNPATGACTFAPTNTLCDNGIYCDGAEVCDPAGAPGPNGCKPGPAVTCAPTGTQCSVNVCSEATRSCTIQLDNTLCTAPAICTTGGVCSTSSCTSDANCTDNNACNGIETCDLSGGSPGTCKAGTPPAPCNDNKSCTTDSCNPSTGLCVFTASATACNDGNLCNGTETCNPSAGGANATTGCVAGTALSCDLGKSCATYGCNPSTGCTITPGTCPDDGNLCNGTSTCQPTNPQSDANGCVALPAVTCSSSGCVTGTCNPSTGTCSKLPDNTKCACGETCDVTSGVCGHFCNVATCQGKVYQCGDCIDNDLDCGVDTISDKDCLGPCQDNEKGFHGDISGQGHGNCAAVDCYFDQDSGSGNDHCAWDYSCDPNAVAPNYYPSGDSKCTCTPTGISPPPVPNCSGSNCSTLYNTQPAGCWSTTDPTQNYCGALTPNGCDCFGCCTVPGVSYPIFIGSEGKANTTTPYSNDGGLCALDVKNDPTKCHPCLQVASCLNTCALCEICVGKPLPDPSCSQQSCPVGQQLCGGNTGLTCPAGYFCLTGCCAKVPT